MIVLARDRARLLVGEEAQRLDRLRLGGDEPRRAGGTRQRGYGGAVGSVDSRVPGWRGSGRAESLASLELMAERAAAEPEGAAARWVAGAARRGTRRARDTLTRGTRGLA